MAKRESKTKATPSRRRRAPRAKRTPSAKQASVPRGQIGRQTYEQVRKILEEKKLPIGKVFEEVAAATGRQPGTVAVTYYRIARQANGPTRKPRAAKGAPRGRRRQDANQSGLRGVMARAAAAIKELEEIIARQAREIERLGNESRLAARIRRVISE